MTRTGSLILPLLLGCEPEPEPAPPALCDTVLTVREGGVLADGDGCGSVELGVRLLGDGDLAVAWALRDGVVVPTVASSGGGTLRAVVLEGAIAVDGDGPLRWWRQGYQSWAWSGVTDPVAAEWDGDGLPIVGGDGDGLSVVDETAWTSWWAGLLGRPGGGSVLMGAAGATRTKVWTAHADGEAFVVWGGRGEAIALGPGDSVELDPLWIGTGRDPNALWDAYAAAVADRTSPRVPAQVPPTGWATWTVDYSAITEAGVRASLAEMEAIWGARDDLGPDPVLQIDDGWQVRWGDWTAGDDFPSGMGPLAADIRAAGFAPGLWMAPLYVHRDSPTYAAHPDWWVRDLDGQEIRFTNLGSGDYAIVDVTHPEAGPWVRDQVAARVVEGFTYLKLDFLYAGAQEGLRYEPVTGTEAYHRALALLREGAGDAWFLACGAPMLATVGYAESYRSGADIAFEVDPDPRPEYLRWQARSTAARSWQTGRWWWIDADQVMLREPFDDVRITGSAVANAVSGGPILLGDDLAALSDERIAVGLDPELVALRGVRAWPVDPLSFPSGIDAGPTAERFQGDDRVPVVWRFATGEVALLNLGDEGVEAAVGPGTEAITGESLEEGGVRALAPGQGEVWAP